MVCFPKVSDYKVFFYMSLIYVHVHLHLPVRVVSLLCFSLTLPYNYSMFKTERRLRGIAILLQLLHLFIKRKMFTAWHSDTIESRKAHLFFQNRGRGEGEGEEDNWCWPEGEDPLSLLPVDISIKVGVVIARVQLIFVCRYFRMLGYRVYVVVLKSVECGKTYLKILDCGIKYVREYCTLELVHVHVHVPYSG